MINQLVLGSQSPRRRQIMEYFDIPFRQVISEFNEDSIPFKGDPEEYVTLISNGKAEILKPVYPDAVILTADSTVYCDGKIFGKPRDREDAISTLNKLSGAWHSVFTGLTVQKGKERLHVTEETRILLNPLTQEQIRTYINRFPWADKAGGYGIQEGGGLIVNRIEGCFFNVMGLPINALCKLFARIGIDLWQHIKA
jgi:septum formation protein